MIHDYSDLTDQELRYEYKVWCGAIHSVDAGTVHLHLRAIEAEAERRGLVL